FYPRAEAMNIRNAWSSWNGYKFAEYYYDAEYEYFCVRNSCATYDICPMQKYHVKGADAGAMLNRMVTRDISRLPLNRVTYVVWCTDEGRMVDDGTIFHVAENEYMLICGSPCNAWLRMSAFGFEDVEVNDLSDEIAALSLQGPTSCAVLKKMGLIGIENSKRFDIQHFPFEGDSLMVSRTGFTGDLGYELWVKHELALRLWDQLYAAGEAYGIQPFGEQATNMARLEAGFLMPAMEFNEALKTVHFEHDQTPFELNLGWLVDFDKPHFNGRAALLREKQRGPKYTLSKLDIEGNKPAEGSYLYSNERCTRQIGYVTSAMWSPAVKANIALAMVETKHLGGDIWAEIYFEKEIRQYSKVARCTVSQKPFWAPARATATPPADF
ncbi:MAG: aminomethyltransferase family protein, partial [Woeseiaceae bacterium]